MPLTVIDLLVDYKGITNSTTKEMDITNLNAIKNAQKLEIKTTLNTSTLAIETKMKEQNFNVNSGARVINLNNYTKLNLLKKVL